MRLTGAGDKLIRNTGLLTTKIPGHCAQEYFRDDFTLLLPFTGLWAISLPFSNILYTNPAFQVSIQWKFVTNDQQRDWFEALYQTKAASLLLYGRSLGLSHGEAEDVLQETFLALMQRPRIPLQPEHYVIRCFRNRALNYRRNLWRRLTRELESKRWFERGSSEGADEREAMRCLAELPPEQCEVIVLKIWHEYTFEQIGELLEISPNTAAGRYRYGLQKLKACLKGASYEHGTIRESFALVGATPPLSEG